MKTFYDLEFKQDVYKDGIHAKIEFENGYGVSVIRNSISYGHEDGLYELAVMKNDRLCYSTPITDDVKGFLTEDMVTDLLKQIQELE